MAVTLNASTSTGYIQTADTSGDLALQSNGTTQFNVTSTGAYGQLKSGTAVSPTVSTSVEFTNLPSWVKRITVMFSGVSTNGVSPILIQLGDAGGFEITGYSSSVMRAGVSSNAYLTSTAGFLVQESTVAASLYSGIATISLIGSNNWAQTSFVSSPSASNSGNTAAGSKTLSDTLDRLRLYIDGTQQFDAGTINILYEG